jgi:hypothetical protein
MKKAIVIFIIISMLCVSISGAAVSINKSVNKNISTNYEKLTINKPTESPEINTQVLNNINQEVNKYLNFGEYIKSDPPRRTVKEINFPWHLNPQAMGDFVEWIIYVNYKEINGEEKHFQEKLNIDPLTFRKTYLEHAWVYYKTTFDTNEDGTDDLEVYYSIFFSTLLNTRENIESKSIRSCVRIRTEDMLVRNAKLEVWSEIKLNYGLIKDLGKSYDKPISFDYKTNKVLNKFLEIIKTKVDNFGFNPFIKLCNWLSNKFQGNNAIIENNPPPKVSVVDTDWLALGVGIVSPEGENIPLYIEKYFNVAKDNIFSPIIFEQELHEVGSQDTLGLLFGFQAGHESQNPTKDISFEIDFDPAIFVRTQFIPRTGYVYYYYDTGSAYSKETSLTFTTNGFGIDDVELSLIFDNTNPIAQNGNWMSFDINWLGFEYRGNKKHSVSVLLTSPSFSAKLKLDGIPTGIKCDFDVDLSFTYQQGQLLDVSGTGSLSLTMQTEMDNVILYYPELSANEPKVEFVKVNSVPSTEVLSAYAHLKIINGTMTDIMGEGYVDLTMSSSLGNIKVFYRKADPSDPDKLFINVPNGIPASQKVGAKAELYMNLNNFSYPDNYVYGNLYRTASGDIAEISGYLPGEDEPIVKLTEIPANMDGEGKLTWNKLEGYMDIWRSGQQLDPVELNIDIGTFNIYNYFRLGDGEISLSTHLAQQGYFDFYTTNNMIADDFRITDTSTGNQLEIGAGNVDADVSASWNLDLNQQPIKVEDLAFAGEISLLKNLYIEATYQGKNLNFDMNWVVGQSGEISLNFTQDEPIELIVDDLFPNNPTWNLGGGVIISDDFHFDIQWQWKQGVDQEDPGYFIVNGYTNEPNFDWIGIIITYDPSASNNPKYGLEIGGYNVSLLVWAKWWKDPDRWFPMVWWYVDITGSFYANLLWEGVWYDNIQTW